MIKIGLYIKNRYLYTEYLFVIYKLPYLSGSLIFNLAKILDYYLLFKRKFYRTIKISNNEKNHR